MIIEEFDFYQMLCPRMQSELIKHCFKDTLQQFQQIFAFCEDGFRNELVINMFSR